MKRVLVVSDPAFPYSNTGFGIAAGKIIEALLARGLGVIHLARGMQPHHATGEPRYRVYIPPASDANAYQYIGQVCEWERPDVILFEADPVSVNDWRRVTQVRRVPNVVHMPTEGGPLLRPWSDCVLEILRQGGAVTTYTQFSREVTQDGLKALGQPLEGLRPIEALGLGLDHAPFAPLDPRAREETREALGWTDKFVVINVARNAGRKNWPRLLEAIKLAVPSVPNIHLYAHTVPFENYNLAGHNLMELARYFGVQDRLQFPSQLRDPLKGADYETLIALYGAADLFVSASGAEGWNLPLTEAAACGLPVVTPSYSGGYEVGQCLGAVPLPVASFETHSSGVRLACVDPEEIAFLIWKFARDEAWRKERGDVARRGSQNFKWGPTVDRLAQLCEEL